MFNWFKKAAVAAKITPKSKAAPLQGGSSITQLAISESIAFLKQGDVHFRNGQLEDVAECCRRAIALNPHCAEAYANLGYVFQIQGNLDEAIASYRRAQEIKPDFAQVHNNLGDALKTLGQLDEAVACFRRALVIKPDFVMAHYNLGDALKAHGQLDDAVASYRQALKIKPDFAEAHSNLGNALKAIGQLDEAVTSYRRALEIKPDYAMAHYNLGNALKDLGQLNDAVLSYRRALEIKPDYAQAHYNLGYAQKDLGQLGDAVASYRRSLVIKPDFEAHGSLIFTLDMASDMDISALHDERKRWVEAHAAHLLQHRPHANVADPERRLRIGYVSADFKMHSAASAFGAMLTNFDRSKFEVFAYSNTVKEDQLTQHFRQSATCWRKIVGLSDDAVADLIRRDDIDILVDLSGLSAGNRLLVFARKPAPIQITAWGYASGTGMQAMDVLFSDAVVVPPEEKQFYTEQVRYLPCLLAHSPHQIPPPVNDLPALSAGRITFGSFNRLIKISDDAYQTWARVLLSVPNSRMLLKTGELDDAETRARVTGHFTRAGVAPERLSLLGKTSWQEHMAAFNRVDISLDPFPQGGGVTTLEGLLMGVPVVTLRWPTLSGRTSASILTILCLTDWIAWNPEQYVEIAVRKTQNISALAELRQQMRTHFTSSIIGDADAYVSAVEQEYRQLWREWCVRQN